MNRTYKVAKSLTRGVVVTSEKASSYQGKAVKTVVAAAVALMATGAFAAATDVTLDGKNIEVKADQEVVVTKNTETASKNEVTITVSGGKITLNNVNNTTVTDDQSKETEYGANLLVSGGDVVVQAGTANNFKNMAITGGTLTIDGGDTTGGAWRSTTNVGGYAWKDEDGNRSTLISNATVKINNGMLWGGAQSGDDEIRKASPLIIKNSKVELSGKTVDQSGILYTGTGKPMQITGSTVTVAKDQFGTIFTPELAVENSTITNAGTLNIAFSNSQTEKVSESLNSAQEAKSAITLGQGTTFNTAEKGTTNITAKLTVDGAAVTNAGTLNTKTVTIKSGKIENAGEGVFSADKISIEGNGVLKTTYTKDTFKWNEITVKDNGVLNLDALNSRHDGKTIGTKDTDGNVLAGDRLLINAGTINLAGGELQVAGTKYEGDLKIGRSETNAKVTVTSDYSFNKVEFGSSKKVTGDNPASTLTIGSDDKTGKLTIADLDLTYGAVTVNDGSTLTLGTVSAVDTGTLTNDGYLLTGISNLVKKDGTATDFASKALNGTGSVVETSITGEYSLEDLKKYAALLKDQELIIKNGTLAKNADGSNHKLSDVDGLTVFNSTVTNSTTTASVTKETTVGALAFTGDAVKGKDVTISGNLQLTGVNGEIITGVDADKTITITGTPSGDGVMFGAEDDDLFSYAPVSVNNKVVVSDNSQLTTKGTVTFAKAVELNTSGKIEARNGVFTFDSIKGGSVYNDGGSVIVKNAAPAAATGKSTAAETVTYDKAFALDTQYYGDKGAFFTFGQNKASKASTEALIRQYDENLDADDEIGASLYVSERYDLTNGGIALGADVASTTKGTLSAAQGSYIVLDMGSIASKNYDPETSGVFQGVTSGNGSVAGTILLTDLTADGFVKDEKTGNYSLNLGANVTPQGTVITDAHFYKVDVSDSTVTLSADQDELDYLKDLGLNNAWLVEHDIKEMTNSGNFFANALIYGNEALDAYYDKAEAEWAKIAEAGNVTTDDFNAYWAAKEAYMAESEIVGSNMAVFGGAFTTALDVNDQVTAAVSRRTSAQRTEGFTPWVDVFGTTNEAKRLYGNGAGYEADIYGAVLGFDYTAACGGTLGVAFNVGQADSNSVGTGVKVDNDADFYGFSLYGAQTFGDFNVKADLGYTQISNDLSSTGAFGTVKESLDSNVFTFGLGTEYLAKFGALNITPHAGIRLSRIDMDDSKYGADYDTMTVYQLPLGVAFSGNFDVNGWKLAPTVDLSVVPAFGDKDAVASFYGNDVTTRVVDTNPLQATLGVSAQNGAWTFGLNYGLTAGGDDRMNNAFNANLRYSF